MASRSRKSAHSFGVFKFNAHSPGLDGPVVHLQAANRASQARFAAIEADQSIASVDSAKHLLAPVRCDGDYTLDIQPADSRKHRGEDTRWDRRHIARGHDIEGCVSSSKGRDDCERRSTPRVFVRNDGQTKMAMNRRITNKRHLVHHGGDLVRNVARHRHAAIWQTSFIGAHTGTAAAYQDIASGVPRGRHERIVPLLTTGISARTESEYNQVETNAWVSV